MKTTQTKPTAKQRWWGLAAALGCLVVSACTASVQGDASLKTGKDPDAPVRQFDQPLEAPAVKAEPVSENFQVEEYALLGARHDLSYAGPTRASCQCLAVTLSDRVDDPAFQWELGAPRLEPTTQWVIAFSSNGVSCDATPPGTLGASYQGYGVEGNDVVVYVEALGEGRPMTSGAIIPRPQSGGFAYIEPAGAIYGKPLEGKGKRCKVTAPAVAAGAATNLDGAAVKVSSPSP